MQVYITLSSGQPGQKEGDSTNNVDIQYGESEITIRLKEDQTADKQGQRKRERGRERERRRDLDV